LRKRKSCLTPPRRPAMIAPIDRVGAKPDRNKPKRPSGHAFGTIDPLDAGLLRQETTLA